MIRDSFLDVICAGRGKLDHEPLLSFFFEKIHEPLLSTVSQAAIDLRMGNTTVETDTLTVGVQISDLQPFLVQNFILLLQNKISF